VRAVESQLSEVKKEATDMVVAPAATTDVAVDQATAASGDTSTPAPAAGANVPRQSTLPGVERI
jgi:hypothetical protein